MTGATDESRKPQCFDLVELIDAVDGIPAGSLGTVIVEGIDQALVDFSWCDPGTPAGCNRTQRVSNRSMKVVESRSFDQAVRAWHSGSTA